ncbi:MAG: Uncharacterised protein [Halieaceae bacterium]|nr:MAG: Uncharacterised protein [Halieaceae bacterium]
MGGETIPDCHQRGFSTIALGNTRAAKAGVNVKASKRLTTNITITAVARLPKKSPEGPSNMAIGVNARTVVAVALTRGTVIRRTEFSIAAIAVSPANRRLRISSVTTMEPSTSSPSATTRPVIDNWWIGTLR